MGKSLKVALVLDLILILLEPYVEGLHGLLPLGGSSVTQLGTLLIGAVIVEEIRDTLG